MKLYNAKCPLCGTENKNMYLEETDGWMECEHCHAEVRVEEFMEKVKTPVYSMRRAAVFTPSTAMAATK